MIIFNMTIGYSDNYYLVLNNNYTVWLSIVEYNKFYNLEDLKWYLFCDNNDMYKNMFLQLYFYGKKL